MCTAWTYSYELGLKTAHRTARVTGVPLFHLLGSETEWKMQIIPQQLTPTYRALTGCEWPLNAKHTFGIAMWLTRDERANLPGSSARKRPLAPIARK